LDNLSCSEGDVENVPPPKRVRVFVMYNAVEELCNLKEATAHIKSAAIFNYDTRKESTQGTKHYYLCKTDPKRPSKAYLLMSSMNINWDIYLLL